MSMSCTHFQIEEIRSQLAAYGLQNVSGTKDQLVNILRNMVKIEREKRAKLTEDSSRHVSGGKDRREVLKDAPSSTDEEDVDSDESRSVGTSTLGRSDSFGKTESFDKTESCDKTETESVGGVKSELGILKASSSSGGSSSKLDALSASAALACCEKNTSTSSRDATGKQGDGDGDSDGNSDGDSS